jgi:hypothetical protein
MTPLHIEIKEEADLIDLDITSVPLFEELEPLCVYKNESISTPIYINTGILSPKLF